MPNNESKSWWEWIVWGATGLAEIYSALVAAGIITQGEADDMEHQDLTREEIAAIVEQRIAAVTGWQQWLPWVITAGLGAGFLVLLFRRK